MQTFAEQSQQFQDQLCVFVFHGRPFLPKNKNHNCVKALKEKKKIYNNNNNNNETPSHNYEMKSIMAYKVEIDEKSL